MHQVFISYRREGGEAMAQLLHDRLSLKGFRVFYDIESLKSGPFDTKIYDTIEQCADFLLVLPAQALERCIYEEDWVRKEIAHALRLEKNIVPIMMRGFTFPNDLPEDIAAIRMINGIAFDTMEYLEAKIDRICSLLTSSPSQNATSVPTTPPRSIARPLIGNICSIGSNDENNCWPTGNYSSVINRDTHRVICFHLTVNNIPRGSRSIRSTMRIFNSHGNLLLDSTVDLQWQDHFDRLARSWILRGIDGSFIPSGTYRAQFIVNNSDVHEYTFEVTTNAEVTPKNNRRFSFLKNLF